MSGDRDDARGGADTDPGATPEETRRVPEWSTVNWAVIVGFTALTIFGMALSLGVVESVVTTSGDRSGVKRDDSEI